MVEFYSHFFYLVGKEIIEEVEEYRPQRKINKSLDSTYITLILKKDHSDSFNDYCPISLCNLLYKLISNIIAETLKSFLAKFILEEQFDFLLDRQITNVVGVVQECLNSGKVKKKRLFFFLNLI